MNLRLLFDRDCAVRALDAEWFIHRSYSSLLFLGQLVVADEMVRCAAVEDKSSIRGIHGLRESKILYREELDVHIVETPSKTVPGFTRHAPCFLPSCPFTKLNILLMVMFVRIRWIIARPRGTNSFGSPSVLLYVSYLDDVLRKIDLSARVAPRNQDARVAFCTFGARVAPPPQNLGFANGLSLAVLEQVQQKVCPSWQV